jgi:hypothetical protein
MRTEMSESQVTEIGIEWLRNEYSNMLFADGETIICSDRCRAKADIVGISKDGSYDEFMAFEVKGSDGSIRKALGQALLYHYVGCESGIIFPNPRLAALVAKTLPIHGICVSRDEEIYHYTAASDIEKLGEDPELKTMNIVKQAVDQHEHYNTSHWNQRSGMDLLPDHTFDQE